MFTGQTTYNRHDVSSHHNTFSMEKQSNGKQVTTFRIARQHFVPLFEAIIIDLKYKTNTFNICTTYVATNAPESRKCVCARNRPISVYRLPLRALTLCPQLCMGIQPGARFPARSANALPATLYGHFSQAMHRNRPMLRRPRSGGVPSARTSVVLSPLQSGSEPLQCAQIRWGSNVDLTRGACSLIISRHSATVVSDPIFRSKTAIPITMSNSRRTRLVMPQLAPRPSSASKAPSTPTAPLNPSRSRPLAVSGGGKGKCEASFSQQRFLGAPQTRFATKRPANPVARRLPRAIYHRTRVSSSAGFKHQSTRASKGACFHTRISGCYLSLTRHRHSDLDVYSSDSSDAQMHVLREHDFRVG